MKFSTWILVVSALALSVAVETPDAASAPASPPFFSGNLMTSQGEGWRQVQERIREQMLRQRPSVQFAMHGQMQVQGALAKSPRVRSAMVRILAEA